MHAQRRRKRLSRDVHYIQTELGPIRTIPLAPPQDIPDDKSPARRKEWWDGLSDEERQEYLAVAPDLIGNLDGIPSLVRDAANRAYLPVLIDSLEQQSGPEARTKLEGLRAIERALTTPRMYLLGIGDEGTGRAIVSYGNPDTSKTVTTHVPDPGTKLNADFAEETLRPTLTTRAQPPSSATIIWLTTDTDRETPAYAEFLSGLSATNTAGDESL
ncbi:hypothetical protein [Streptomyces niveus]|uniref:hypothetical protein n=1 Tax=Streptomyces niveus TaxID=193462 RepID=UPI00363B6B7D